ncbi:hypothetical protein [Gynuella sp.]|uniref:hypothetical protein n=1 Tax=Gynuella sp. TaxID=2969146 RepID=UPI003D0BDE06
MAMDIFVLIALSKEPDIAYLNEKAKQLNLPIVYNETLDMNQQNGFYPLNLNGDQSGFEIYKISYEEIIQQLPEPDAGFIDQGVAYHFRYSFSHKEPASAFYTAALFSTLENAIVFETQAGEYLSTKQLVTAGNMLFEME